MFCLAFVSQTGIAARAFEVPSCVGVSLGAASAAKDNPLTRLGGAGARPLPCWRRGDRRWSGARAPHFAFLVDEKPHGFLKNLRDPCQCSNGYVLLLGLQVAYLASRDSKRLSKIALSPLFRFARFFNSRAKKRNFRVVFLAIDFLAHILLYLNKAKPTPNRRGDASEISRVSFAVRRSANLSCYLPGVGR